jgi:hypothetical protein
MVPPQQLQPGRVCLYLSGFEVSHFLPQLVQGWEEKGALLKIVGQTEILFEREGDFSSPAVAPTQTPVSDQGDYSPETPALPFPGLAWEEALEG